MQHPDTRVVFALLVLALAGAAPAQAELDRTERAIAQHAAAGQPAAVALLQRVVDIESPTENVAGVRAVGEAFAEELRSIGFRTRWVELPAGMHRAGHLVAESGGTHGQRLLLLGHLDTVLAGERFRREGARAFGTGTADMKGGVVVMVQALKALHAAGALDGRQITVMLTGDEEDAGMPLRRIARADARAARQSDIALSFESAIEGTATIGRARDVDAWTLETTGETGHSSAIFGAERGSGAVYEAARILAAFQAELGAEKYLTINPSLIVGGTKAALDDYRGSAEGKTNVIAPKALVRGDIRYISLDQERSARERMEAIVARHLPRTGATLHFDEGPPADDADARQRGAAARARRGEPRPSASGRFPPSILRTGAQETSGSSRTCCPASTASAAAAARTRTHRGSTRASTR